MARMAAGTRKRDDGTLEKRFTVEGKRYSVYGKTAKEITEKEQEIRKAISENAHTNRMNIKFSTYYAEWIGRKSKTIKENTLYTYRTQIKDNQCRTNAVKSTFFLHCAVVVPQYLPQFGLINICVICLIIVQMLHHYISEFIISQIAAQILIFFIRHIIQFIHGIV